MLHCEGGDTVLECPPGREVGRERADDLTERAPAVQRERRALVAHDFGLRRRHDRAVAPGGDVLAEPSQPVAGMAAELRTHEQLREARCILVARSDPLRDVAGEALRLGAGECPRHPWDCRQAATPWRQCGALDFVPDATEYRTPLARPAHGPDAQRRGL